ncbi:MAG: serine/threonine protein kinase, partial [Myxococcales bacterium]|nr:serine/threonine protein kinase [Myxococcales bacterium]
MTAHDQVADDQAETPPPSQRHLGKYELLRLLARGGMGEVHLARLGGELGFEKHLVVKTIRAELAADPHFVELFAAEARTAVALNHPNIAPIYELGRAEDGSLYTAMGWVDGPSLQQLLERLRSQGEQLEPAAALYIIREVLDGLAYAHSSAHARPSLVHRDLTPRNVLVDRSGRVQIVDFGIAKPVDAEVRGIMGSAGYMAPEQARGGAVDPRADVFSVGCVLYELLSGHRAFPSEGVWVSPQPLTDLAGQSPVLEVLPSILDRALAIEPGRRYADAGEFLRALAPVLAEFAPAYGTLDLAALLRTRFPDGWEQAPSGDGEGDGQTPATRQTGEVRTFATRLTPLPRGGTSPDLEAQDGDAASSKADDAEQETPVDLARVAPSLAITALEANRKAKRAYYLVTAILFVLALLWFGVFDMDAP